MKLFKFYPNDFCRMYVMGKSKEEVQSRADELFNQYMKNNYSWVELNDPDEAYYIEEQLQDFEAGLAKLIELPLGMAIDSHY